MTPPPISPKHNAAILNLLEQCGQTARSAASQPFEVFEKGTEDYVTTVDRALDRTLADAFAKRFPSDGIITEENGASAQAFATNRDRLWFIDPIDGTEDFINQGQHYAIMVGLWGNALPTAGWIAAPAQAQLYWGGPNWGLFQRDAHGTVTDLVPQEPKTNDPAFCRMVFGDRDQRRFGAAIAQFCPALSCYSLGSYGLKVLEVIQGRAGLYVYLNGRVKLWDTTGPLALAIAAGLTCCDLDGHPIRFDATSVYPGSLIHHQPIVVGWPGAIAQFRAPLRQAVMTVRCQELRDR